MSDDEIKAIGRATGLPWGIGSTWADAIAFAHAIEQASRRAALIEGARLVELNGYDGAAFDIRALAASDSDGSKS